jgi:hypothetical protein
MDKMKEHSSYVTMANTVGIISSAVYFQRQLDVVKADMKKSTLTLTGIVRKLAEIEKGDQNKTEALHTLNEHVKRMNDALNDIPQIDKIEEDLDEIVNVLTEHNIEVDRPSLHNKKQQNKNQGYRRDREMEDRKDGSNRKKVNKDKPREVLKERASEKYVPYKKETRTQVKYEEDEEADTYDIIGDARRQVKN